MLSSFIYPCWSFMCYPVLSVFLLLFSLSPYHIFPVLFHSSLKCLPHIYVFIISLFLGSNNGNTLYKDFALWYSLHMFLATHNAMMLISLVVNVMLPLMDQSLAQQDLFVVQGLYFWSTTEFLLILFYWLSDIMMASLAVEGTRFSCSVNIFMASIFLSLWGETQLSKESETQDHLQRVGKINLTA